MENQDWKIEFNWIKAHAGHHGSELADRTAKEATTNSDMTKKVAEKILKCEDLTIEIQRMCNIKTKVIPVIIWATGTILK